MVDRHTRLTEGSRGPLEDLSEEQVAAREARNALLQFDEMQRIILSSTREKKPFRLRPSAIMELNRIAVDGLEPSAGAFRAVNVAIEGSQHSPPEWEDVTKHVEEMCDFMNSKWDSSTPLFLASYVMWRLNWIHPFSNGNGRTARVVSYLVLCVRLGYLLPGKRTIPDMIAQDKGPYYQALDQADIAWFGGECNVSAMEELLHELLAGQLVDVVETATGNGP